MVPDGMSGSPGADIAKEVGVRDSAPPVPISGRETFLPELTSQRFGPLQQGIEHNRWNAQTRVNFIELAQFV
jgi:hypothetical protein